MRSTRKAPDRVHSVSWHLMKRRRVRSMLPSRMARLSQRSEVIRLGCEAMYRATQASATAVINAMWDNSQRREPPESEATTQNTPIKPPPIPGGAEACTEIPMPNVSPEELQRQHHEIARMAADTAGRVASHIPFERQSSGLVAAAPTAASAGKAVVDAYQSALKQLSDGSVCRDASAATGA